MAFKQLMKQYLGAVFVGCLVQFGHFWRIGYTPCRRVLCNVSNDLLVFGAPEPPPALSQRVSESESESQSQRVRVSESESESQRVRVRESEL